MGRHTPRSTRNHTLVPYTTLFRSVIAALTRRRRPGPMLRRLLLTIALTALVVIASDFRFGRDTACALLLAMLALKVAEVRSLRDARSLAGFALFATFAAFLQEIGRAHV